MGGIQFLGVDGAPTTPWKFDKNNWQLRVGMAYSDQRKDGRCAAATASTS